MDLTGKHTFTLKTKVGEFDDCYFKAGHYKNSNVAILIESGEDEEPILTASVNPWQQVEDSCVAIKNYSGNEGIVDVLKEQGIITGEPEYEIPSGYVVIPCTSSRKAGRTRSPHSSDGNRKQGLHPCSTLPPYAR